MKALKLAAVLLSTTVLCCGVSLVSSDNAVAGMHLSADEVPVGTPELPLHLAQAESRDLARTPGSPVAPATDAPVASTATADDIVVTSGTTTIRIKHVEVAGSSLSKAELSALFNTKDPKVLEARLRTLEAASIIIPEIIGDSVDGLREVHFTQKDVLLANVKNGRAATGSAADATFAFKDDKNDTKGSTGATTFKGLDIAQIAHFATGSRTDNGEPSRPICDEIVIQNSTIGGAIKNGPPVAIATIRGTGIKGRPLIRDLGDLSNDAKADAAALNDIAHSFSADLVEAEGFALASTPSASTNGLKSLALKHVAVHGFGDGKLARFELSGLAMEGNDKQPGKLALASAVIENVATNATPVPSVDRIDLHDFTIDVPTDDKSGQRLALSVARAGYEAPGLVIGSLPAKATLSIEHATFDVPPDSGAAPMLLAMGYKHLDLSSEDRSRYNAAAQTLDLDRVSVTGVGMGVLAIKLDLVKVSEGIVSQVDTVQKAAAAAVLVKTVDFTLRNDGLIDKAIGFKAAADGVSVDEERTNLVQLIDTGVVGFGLQDSAKAQLIVAALHKFIADPKTLHIALASKDGLGADAIPLIGSPQALLDVLEVQAGANE